MDNPTESRFFIDHGVVHDRKTGKHVRCGCFPYEGTTEDFLALLQELEAPRGKLVGYVNARGKSFIEAGVRQRMIENKSLGGEFEVAGRNIEERCIVPVYADLP